MKSIFYLILLSACLVLPAQRGIGQDNADLLSNAKALLNQGKISESLSIYQRYFGDNPLDHCSATVVEDLESYAMTALFSRSASMFTLPSAAEQCAKDSGQDDLWSTYLIHHGEALRTISQYDAAKEKLKTALAYPKLSPKDRAQSYAVLSFCFAKEKGDSTALYANRALEIALKIPDTVAILESYHALSVNANSSGKLHEAIDWNRRALNFAKGPYSVKKAETFGNIAALFLKLKDYPKAEKYIDSTFQSVDTSVYIQFTALIKMTQGKIFEQTERWEQAKSNYQFVSKKSKRDKNKFFAFLGLSRIAKAEGETANAQKYLNQALAIGEISELPNIQQSVALLNSKKALAEKKYEAAIQFANKGIKIQEASSETTYIPELYLQLALATEKLNQPNKSLQYYKKYYQGRDSMTNLINQELVYTLENEYTLAEQDKELTSLHTQNTLQDLKLKQQRWQGLGILIFLSLLAGTIFFLFQLNKKIKTQTLTIQDAVAEKNILLKEIHHRVKNNLQVISSLFNLQSRFVKDSNALEALKESHNRVNSLALLHQNLYQEENLKGIEMPSYIDQLCDSLFSASSNTNYSVNYQNKISPLTLDIDTVIPLGLIITELISSALKRNYSDQKPGMIQVELNESQDTLTLRVKDNSLPEQQHSIDDKKSFSQKIIDAFSKKLKASVDYNQENGTEVNLIIRKYRIAS